MPLIQRSDHNGMDDLTGALSAANSRTLSVPTLTRLGVMIRGRTSATPSVTTKGPEAVAGRVVGLPAPADTAQQHRATRAPVHPVFRFVPFSGLWGDEVEVRRVAA